MLVFELRWLRASHPRIVNHLEILYEIGSLHARARARAVSATGGQRLRTGRRRAETPPLALFLPVEVVFEAATAAAAAAAAAAVLARTIGWQPLLR